MSRAVRGVPVRYPVPPQRRLRATALNSHRGRRRDPALRWWIVALAGGLVLVPLAAAAAWGGWFVARPLASPVPARIIYAEQVTAQEGSDAAPPPALVARADEIAADGAGQLVMLRGAGKPGLQAGPVTSLAVEREPGQAEHDPIARRADSQAVIDHAFKVARDIPVAGEGRDVIGLLSAVSAARGGGANDVYLHTLCLATVDPADTRTLMAADPAQAVASIAGQVPSLSGMRVHLLLAAPAGDQPAFNTATERWRRDFCVALLRATGAELASVDQVLTIETAEPGAPAAPVIPLLTDPTPVPIMTPPTNPTPAPQTITTRLDTATTFLPDSDAYATDEQSVLAQLKQIIASCSSNPSTHIDVVGRAARFGPRAGAQALSEQRARRTADLLRRHGCPAVSASGLGYDQPLPPDPRDPANRSVTVTSSLSG